MKPEWPLVSIIDLQAPQKWALNGGPFGSKLVTRDYVPFGVPVIRGINLPIDSRFHMDDFVYVSEEKADELLPNNAHPGDVIFTQRGTLGQVGIVPFNSPFKRFVISQSQMKMTVDITKINPFWLFYAFRNPLTQQALINRASSSGVPHINLETLRQFIIALPPYPIQQKISAILSAYDDLIENNLRRIKILEEMAQLLYREWFVKFCFPRHENVPMVDSPLGKIPEGWRVTDLKNAMELCYGKSLREEDRAKGEVPVYGSSGIVGYHNEATVRGPGIIVGRKGNVGSVHWSESDFCPIDTVYYVKTALPLTYVFYNLQGQNFINSDAAVPGLSRKQAYALALLIPAQSVLSEFDRQAELIFSLISIFSQKNALIRRTRDLLLPKLISGELDVSEMDIKAREDLG